MRQHVVHKFADVVVRTHLKHFLAQVVSKLVSHDVGKNVEHPRHQFGLILVSSGTRLLLQSFLDHAAAGLVEGKHLNLLDRINFFLGQK